MRAHGRRDLGEPSTRSRRSRTRRGRRPRARRRAVRPGLVFAGAPTSGAANGSSRRSTSTSSPRHLIGCGAGGVLGGGREIEDGPGARSSGPPRRPRPRSPPITSRRSRPPTASSSSGVPEPDAVGDALIVLADPYTFATEALLEPLGELRPGMPVLGGLASAAAAGSASLFRDGEVAATGARSALARGRRDAAVRLAGRRAGRPRDDDHGRGGQRDRGAAPRSPRIERLREAIGRARRPRAGARGARA